MPLRRPLIAGPGRGLTAALAVLAALVQLSSGRLLSFAAVDPAPGTARVRVIASGGGLVSATAS